VHAGSAALEQKEGDAVQSRIEAIDASSGKYAGAFGPDYLTGLRQDWPE
jgi:hypothetical protein